MERQVWCSIAAIERDQDSVGGGGVDIPGDLGERRHVHVGRGRICEDDERRHPSDVEVAPVLLTSRAAHQVIVAGDPTRVNISERRSEGRRYCLYGGSDRRPVVGTVLYRFKGAPTVSWQLSVKFKGTMELVGYTGR